jgi:hypothetical protein
MINSDMDLSKTQVSVVPGHVSSELDGEEVILNLENGTYYGLNEVGARIWALLQEESSLAGVRDRLMEEYDVDAERCEQDVVHLTKELEEAGLVEIQPSRHEPS